MQQAEKKNISTANQLCFLEEIYITCITKSGLRPNINNQGIEFWTNIDEVV